MFSSICAPSLKSAGDRWQLGFKLCGAVNLLTVLECHENFTALFVVHMHMKGSFLFFFQKVFECFWWKKCSSFVSCTESTLSLLNSVHIHCLRFSFVVMSSIFQWRTRGGIRVFKPPPEIPKAFQKIVPNSTPLWKLLKNAEFRTPTHQDVRKKKAVKF